MNDEIVNCLEEMIQEVENRPIGFGLQPKILNIILELYKSGKNEILSREVSKILKDSGTKYPSICGTMKKITKKGIASIEGKATADVKLIFKK